jgi:phosphoserine phosphatase
MILASTDSRFNAEVDRRTGYRTRSLLSVPLRGVNGETIGVLQLARNLQRSLLPVSDPPLAGYEISSWTQAAAATGGDFYDYLEFPDGRLGLVVADVAGHGLAASLLACETCALIRSAASTTSSLVEIASKANDNLYRDLHHELFVVLLLGALDARTQRLEFVGAGCGPMLHRAREGLCVYVEATIPPLAVVPALPVRATREVRLGAGDLSVVATDGLYEWENREGQQFGMDRLRESVSTHASLAPGDLIRRLYEDVSTYAAPVKHADDLTAMVVRRATA